MPREQITHNPILTQAVASTAYLQDPAEVVPEVVAHIEVPRRNVHVAWNRTGGSGALGVQHDTGWVQLGIDLTVADLRSMLDAAVAEAQAQSRKLADVGEFDIEQWQYRVMSDVIDRRETNLAIATLRRARDTAYGKDA